MAEYFPPIPTRGRYGKGVIAWELSASSPKGSKTKLVGAVADKPNHMATIHLSKGAPKSTRLDTAGLRKRAATKGDVVVEVKPGEEVISVNVNWTVEKFVGEMKKEERGKKKVAKAKTPAKTKSPKGKKPSSKKKAKATAKKKSAPKKASKLVKKKKKK